MYSAQRNGFLFLVFTEGVCFPVVPTENIPHIDNLFISIVRTNKMRYEKFIC